MYANAPLIGAPGGRARLDTPALVVDLPALKRNISRMAALAQARGIALRPHVKSHKSARIARLQIDAGAHGVSCATLGEAQVMVDAGIRGVLVTSPVVGEHKVHRLVELARKAGPRAVMAVVDHPDNVAELASAAASLAFPLGVLIDYHAGYGRTGVTDEHAALALAKRIGEAAPLALRGLQAYGGNLQHIGERAQREAAAAALRARIVKIVETLQAAGIELEIVTGVGTGTHDIDSSDEVFTEMQVGSYVFMDAEYAQVLSAASDTRFETSLFVQSTVVSVNAPDWVTVDAGIKSFATDSGIPLAARGIDGPSQYAFFGDEHGKLVVDAPHRPTLGAHIEFVAPHCDPTVNLHQVYHIVDGDTLVGIWPVDARGHF
ncbi:DSD1 family PLP-dependent enzyme [Trinickia caryophylli]|uniref:D-serine deaminase, pyridoxal phosphate-dependent n=1 Tax=Trinickia caryophylli TaxID=28094 RepID=A0A1X7CC59_TRICW|nr:DSD1 family PLP-dependent enzyme [Trinickia caryophylli]PMS12469.1 DSD1 family PLP-dependent enzyme [Trinickia caryophylli]TRX19670.1 DSD1 family PLP-dependent enzyme [Trinickia caryophylli]WQE13015.1 DSD1 family PLP-dependent enzyme [Trinickia caryophylli]SME93602.1 D-serine deaminase, pyridoxal phosphate-dependent [Trinickia caryophylli]GLU30749.1 alanine racemase [Trinickia caryophylli]